MYFSTAGERLLQELKLMEALPEEPQRIKSALAVAEKLTLGLRNHYEANWHPHPAPGRLMKAPIAYAGSIGMTEYGWLHIELNNLLPHCRFSTPEYLHDMVSSNWRTGKYGATSLSASATVCRPFKIRWWIKSRDITTSISHCPVSSRVFITASFRIMTTAWSSCPACFFH